MNNDYLFNDIKSKIVNEMTDNAPIIFISYDFEEQKLECMWKKINKRFKIEKGSAYYNVMNPSEYIFMSDYQDRISKCYHLLNLLYMDYYQGNNLNEENYIINDEVAVDHIANRYKVLTKV